MFGKSWKCFPWTVCWSCSCVAWVDEVCWGNLHTDLDDTVSLRLLNDSWWGSTCQQRCVHKCKWKHEGNFNTVVGRPPCVCDRWRWWLFSSLSVSYNQKNPQYGSAWTLMSFAAGGLKHPTSGKWNSVSQTNIYFDAHNLPSEIACLDLRIFFYILKSFMQQRKKQSDGSNYDKTNIKKTTNGNITDSQKSWFSTACKWVQEWNHSLFYQLSSQVPSIIRKENLPAYCMVYKRSLFGYF